MKNSNLLNYILYSLIFLVGIEILFFSLYQITGSSKFENKYETESRYFKELGVIYNKDQNFKKRAAIFGGSSAAGYASTVNFSHILNNMSHLGDENILFHNFAVPATPFYGLQFEILKKFFDDFDIFIIYAGHNEWMHYEHKKKYFPNNANTTNYKNLLNFWDKMIKKTNLPDENHFITGNSFLFNNFTNNLRTINFFFKSISKIKNISKRIYYKNIVKKSEDSKEFNKIKYYYDERFFENDYNNKWSDNFIDSIEYIKSILPNDKTLIIITPIANYYYPPTADFISKADETYENMASQAYDFLFYKKKDFSSLNLLPEGAHKYYLKGIVCLKNKENTNECIDNLAKSREYDQIPFIVRSKIIKYIKANLNQQKNSNIVHIDLTDTYHLLKNDLKKFNYLFLDIMHPSEYGHLLIANKIGKVLFKSNIHAKANFNYENYIKCPDISYFMGKELLYKIRTSKKQCDITAIKLKSWHKDYVKYIPKNLRFVSDEIINLMNQQLDSK